MFQNVSTICISNELRQQIGAYKFEMKPDALIDMFKDFDPQVQ